MLERVDSSLMKTNGKKPRHMLPENNLKYYKIEFHYYS